MTTGDEQAVPSGPDPCLACRGTGTLISGLGGEPHQVTCPWCRGTGERIPGIDAQEHPAESGDRPTGSGDRPAAAGDRPAAPDDA